MPEKIKKMSITGIPPLIRQNTMGDLEMIDLAPKVEGRIRKLDAQVSLNQGSWSYIFTVSFYFSSYDSYILFLSDIFVKSSIHLGYLYAVFLFNLISMSISGNRMNMPQEKRKEFILFFIYLTLETYRQDENIRKVVFDFMFILISFNLYHFFFHTGSLI